MTVYSWNVTSGLWGTAADWNPKGTPTSADTAEVENGGTATVASGTSAVAGALDIGPGAVNVLGALQIDALDVASTGSLTASGGVITVGPSAGIVEGTVTLANGGEYVFDGVSSSGSSANNVVDFTSSGGVFNVGATWGGTIENFGASASDALAFNDRILFDTYDATNDTLTVYTLSSGFDLAEYSLVFANGGSLSDANFQRSGDSLDYHATCFASGARIRTDRGEVAVEALRVGDLAITASGEARPIRWIGHRRVNCRRHPHPAAVQPIRIAADAFGPGMPVRDLQVSPGHAIGVDVFGEALIPANALLNGATIQQLDVDEVTYWHVELATHDILLAENLPTESYFDAGNRAFFSENEVVQLSLTPEAVKRAQASFCRPFHEAGALADAVRDQLKLRAQILGWSLHHDPFADLHLVVDGRRVEPVVEGRRARFALAPGSREIGLASAATRPCDVDEGADRRTLGVCVAGLVVEAASGRASKIRLDDPALKAGFHDVERRGDQIWRWTQGRANLPMALLGAEPLFLIVELAGDAPARWVAGSTAPEQVALSA